MKDKACALISIRHYGKAVAVELFNGAPHHRGYQELGASVMVSWYNHHLAVMTYPYPRAGLVFQKVSAMLPTNADTRLLLRIYLMFHINAVT